VDRAAIAVIDRLGYPVLEAIVPEGRLSTGTASHPYTFICIDGKTYWVKGNVQQGLVAELICGRLAAKLGAGPAARIVRVTPEVLPAGAPPEIEGIVVGSEDVPGTVNSKDLGPLLSGGSFQPGLIDAAARARVIVFQTWVGAASDAQVLVGLADGAVRSIDHGDCFSTTDATVDPSPVVAAIPGVSNDVGREGTHIAAAVQRVEALTDRDLQQAVSGIPLGSGWRSPVDRRADIGEWLAHRRDKLREVMTAWQLP
jgi:hypothetical protein